MQIRRTRSIEGLHSGPCLAEVQFQPAAEIDVESLVATGIRMPDMSGLFDGGEVPPVAVAVAAQYDDNVAGVTARTPQPVAVVVADCPGKPVLRSKEVHRRGLTPAIREDRGPL